MSLLGFTSALLSITPHVWFDHGVLRSRSHLAIITFSLGTYRRSVVVDADTRTVTVTKRYLYLFKSQRKIAFDDVQRIDYTYESIPTSFNFFGERADELDKFYVSLILNSRDRVLLWGFYGEGAIHSGWAGVLFGGDSAIDLSGDQENAAQGYANVLCAMMEKKLL